MIGRRNLLSATLLILADAVQAQQTPAVPLIGYLTGGTLAGRTDNIAAFKHGLAEFGQVEGRTYRLDSLGADGRFELLPRLVRELMSRGPDVLFVTTTPASLAAKAATTTVPIVFAGVADPLGVGLVDSLARPGANVTGITNLVAELTGKRLELLKEIVPDASRVALIVNPDDPNAPLQINNAEVAANALRLTLRPVLHVRSADDLEPAFAAAAASGSHAALRMVDPTVSEMRRSTAQLAIQYGLPVMYAFREDVTAGGLIAYGTDFAAQHRQAATLVHKILNGIKPYDLPVEQPTKFVLAINLGAARAHGLAIPSSLLARADEVIE